MFGSRLIVTGAVLLALLVVALGAARPSSGAAPETRYVVQPGDTLWEIAAEHYAGDVTEGVWRIEKRNRVSAGGLQPGISLALPG